ncbi:MAG TPA: hypothetical protein VFG62_21210 [Rhodopila sp.]|nr:hypothetical protein [Rhodopila sp.]
MADAKKTDWVSRTLGVQFRNSQKSAGPRQKLLPIWTDAKETVDTYISRLQDALREQEDEDLDSIAEFGLYGVTTGQSVGLMAALREADSSGSAKAYEKVRDAVEDYRDYLEGAPIVDLVEDNPFGVKVPLRDTLVPALNELERIASA